MQGNGDYISRDYVLKCMDDSWKSAGIPAEAKAKMTRWLRKATAADMRPVVLCRDCKMQQYCKVAQYLGEDGFCSNGEKREES